MLHVHGRTVRWPYPTILEPQVTRLFQDLLPYCFPSGIPWRCAESRDAILFEPECNQAIPAIVRRLDEAFERARTTPAVPSQTLLDQWDAPSPSLGQRNEPLDTRWVGTGLQVAGPKASRIMRAVDRIVQGIARDVGAEEYSVPNLIAWDAIARAGYPESFPQHLTMCSVVKPDLAALDSFARAAHPDARAQLQQVVDLAVAPTVCMNLFAALAQQTLDAPLVATAAQSCARYEAGAGHTGTRLWSFAMREIVYVGELRGAREFRDMMLRKLGELLRELGLPARISTANDPFFTAERKQFTSYQSALVLKHELSARLADSDTALAVSSVNLHNHHFGQAFEILLPDASPTASACIGFGLDRWAYWLHGHVGDDPEKWPAPLRQAVEC